MSVFLSLWNTFFVTGHLVTILLFVRGKRLLSSCTATYATKHNVFLLKEGRKYIVPYILSSKYTTYIYCMFQNSLPQVLCPHEDGHKSFILACSLCSNRVEGSRVLRIFMHCLKLTITKAIRLPNWKVPKDSNSLEPPNVLQATPYQFEFLSCIHHIWRPACLSASSPCLLTYLLVKNRMSLPWKIKTKESTLPLSSESSGYLPRLTGRRAIRGHSCYSQKGLVLFQMGTRSTSGALRQFLNLTMTNHPLDPSASIVVTFVLVEGLSRKFSTIRSEMRESIVQKCKYIVGMVVMHFCDLIYNLHCE